MADKELCSPIRRASFAVRSWIDQLGKDAALDGAMALDRLVQVAEREIEEAYRDGASNRSEAVRAERSGKAKDSADVGNKR